MLHERAGVLATATSRGIEAMSLLTRIIEQIIPPSPGSLALEDARKRLAPAKRHLETQLDNDPSYRNGESEEYRASVARAIIRARQRGEEV